MLRLLLPGLLSASFLVIPSAAAPASTEDEVERRLARSPREVAEALAARYGHAMKDVAYIPALALIGRLEVASWSGDSTSVADVRRIAETAVTPPGALSGPAFAGHLIHARLARPERVFPVASLAFDDTGAVRDFVPNHGDMSDAVFMHCPLLAAAGRLSGDPRYLAACRNHFAFMGRLCLRPDGLYRHSPLDEAAWGRGNGFPALGLALVLRELDPASPDHRHYRDALVAHLAALIPHQDESGMWHQVIDHPESYPELSATCMISVALCQGLRQGWLDPATHGAAADRAWDAIKRRVGLDGERVEGVCTGTGKQPSLEAYFQRQAIFGRDDRGGAMALLAAVERHAWESAGSR